MVVVGIAVVVGAVVVDGTTGTVVVDDVGATDSAGCARSAAVTAAPSSPHAAIDTQMIRGQRRRTPQVCREWFVTPRLRG
jgi:hypothetical protein